MFSVPPQVVLFRGPRIEIRPDIGACYLRSLRLKISDSNGTAIRNAIVKIHIGTRVVEARLMDAEYRYSWWSKAADSEYRFSWADPYPYSDYVSMFVEIPGASTETRTSIEVLYDGFPTIPFVVRELCHYARSVLHALWK